MILGALEEQVTFRDIIIEKGCCQKIKHTENLHSIYFRNFMNSQWEGFLIEKSEQNLGKE